MNTEQTNQQRIDTEMRIVRHLVRELKKAGYIASCVWDGGERVKTPTEAKVLKHAFSVDDSTIHFKGGADENAKREHGVQIIGGNGWECIADWHCGDPVFAAAVQAVSEWASQLETAA